jgi:hypothetical protein
MPHVGCTREATLTTDPTMKTLVHLGCFGFELDESVFDILIF